MRIRNLATAALLLLTVAGWTGDILLSYLIDTHPLLFIALNSRNRNLVLASPLLDAPSFYTVALVRLLLSDPLFFLFGRWYGDAAVRWMERKAPTYGQMLRSAERWFGKAAYPMVAIAPNNFICLFAGSAGMNPIAFVVLNVTGTILRLMALRKFGDVFSSPLERLTDFITEYRLQVFLVSLVLVGLSVWSERRSGGTDFEALEQIDREADGTADDGAAVEPPVD